MFEDDDETVVDGFQINQEYARRYQHNKKRQELQELSEKYKNMEDEEEESSTSEEEDENGELLTKELDLNIIKTINLIKQKNEVIYKDYKLEDEETKSLPKAKKTMNLSEYQTNILLGGKDDGETAQVGNTETKAAFENVEIDPEEELFTVKNHDDEMGETEEYKDFIIKNTTVEEEDEFLKEFVLNRGWVQKENPYGELIDDDSEEEEKIEEFERAHNFRFEEGDGAFVIQGHARNVPGVVRRKDDTRIMKRQTLKERKEMEKLKKSEELKRLKSLKKQELKEKLLAIQEMAGGELVGDLGLDKEFDPNEHDKQMDSIFNEDYYNPQEKIKKPKFDSEIDISDLISEPEEEPKKKTFKSIKKKGTMEEIASQAQESNAVPKEEIDRYLDEYYHLDFEDIVGDVPVRFKYRQIEANDYSLGVEEILEADDKDLNEVIGLKKLYGFRSEEQKARDEERWKKTKKKKLWEFRGILKGKKTASEEVVESHGKDEGKKRKAKIDSSRLDSYAAGGSKKKAKK